MMRPVREHRILPDPSFAEPCPAQADMQHARAGFSFPVLVSWARPLTAEAESSAAQAVATMLLIDIRISSRRTALAVRANSNRVESACG
jgi:hypothetical protein